MQTLADLLLTLQFYTWVNDNDWVWPLCEILHFMGMALLFGTVGLLDLRILGFGKGVPISALQKLVPVGVFGFVLNAATGFIFVAGNALGGPMAYFENLAFLIKMGLILLAGINLAVFQFAGLSKAADALAADADAAGSAKLVAAASLAFWLGVIIFGRLIMYNDTLLLALGL
jgi:hypothetical protein